MRRKADKESDIFDFFDHVNEKSEELSYEIDGVVIKINDRKLKDRLSNRDRSPRWAFAMKFEPQKKVTTLVDIIVQVGRTGILTPVALLEPVEGFSEKSANKLYEVIQNSRNPQLDQFLYALGIRHVGRHIARVLAHKYGSLDAVIEADYLVVFISLLLFFLASPQKSI